MNYNNNNNNNNLKIYLLEELGIGDWGLGIGDWAQSPMPNPQSPIPNLKIFNFFNLKYFIYKFF